MKAGDDDDDLDAYILQDVKPPGMVRETRYVCFNEIHAFVFACVDICRHLCCQGQKGLRSCLCLVRYSLQNDSTVYKNYKSIKRLVIFAAHHTRFFEIKSSSKVSKIDFLFE